jgi:UTP--glucose-1-phosphate uridylyltransferase
VIAVQKVPREKINRYGSVQTENTAEKQLYIIKNIVEKPKIEEAPSTIAAIGRYVFTSEIFDCIHETKPGINNELQIADSINMLTKSQKVYACAFEGKRYDIGDKLGYIQAIIDFSLKNKEIKSDIKNYIRNIK